MNKIKLTSLSLLTFLLFLTGCHSAKDNQSEPTTVPQIADPAVLYEDAADALRAKDQLSYYIGSTRTTVMNDQQFTVESQQQLNIQDIGKETVRCSMTEHLQVGTFSTEISEFYENGNGYVIVDGNGFTAPLTPDAVTVRYTPAVCFDPSLYQTVEGISNGGRIQLSFRQPSAGETWALPEGAAFTDATGYAELDENGVLKESVYTISYTLDNNTVSQTTKIILQDTSPVLSPDAQATYTPIEYFDGPRILEQACGYLLQVENITSHSETNINCQTFSISRNQISDMILSGSGEDFSAQLDVKINQTNQSRGGEVSDIRQTEFFDDGVYSISMNGAEVTPNESVDAATMKTYCQEMLIGDILLPQHITGVTAEEADGSLLLTFQTTDSFAEAICSNVCKLLYSDAELLHTLSSSYETQSVQCVLKLDLQTGLPQFFSSEYSALHNIEEISYLLESKTEQTYVYAKEDVSN